MQDPAAFATGIAIAALLGSRRGDRRTTVSLLEPRDTLFVVGPLRASADRHGKRQLMFARDPKAPIFLLSDSIPEGLGRKYRLYSASSFLGGGILLVGSTALLVTFVGSR